MKKKRELLNTSYETVFLLTISVADVVTKWHALSQERMMSRLKYLNCICKHLQKIKIEDRGCVLFNGSF